LDRFEKRIKHFFHFRILLRKDLKGATVLICTHFQTGQLEGVEAAHLLPPGLNNSSLLKPSIHRVSSSTVEANNAISWDRDWS